MLLLVVLISFPERSFISHTHIPHLMQFLNCIFQFSYFHFSLLLLTFRYESICIYIFCDIYVFLRFA